MRAKTKRKKVRLKEVVWINDGGSVIEMVDGGALQFGSVEEMNTARGTVLYSQNWATSQFGKGGDYGIVFGYKASVRYRKRSGAEVVKVRLLTRAEQKRHYSALRKRLAGPITFW